MAVKSLRDYINAALSSSGLSYLHLSGLLRAKETNVIPVKGLKGDHRFPVSKNA